MKPYFGMLGLMNNGLNLIPNDMACVHEKYVQFRFPCSKGKRIRNKWRKRKENWRTEIRYMSFKYGNTLVVPSFIYEEYKKKAVK